DGGWAARVPPAREVARATHAHPAARRISDDEWCAIEDALARIDAAFSPVAALTPSASLSDRARAHSGALEAVIAGADDADAEGASALFELLDRLAHAEAPAGFDAQNYAALFDRVAAETMLRGPRRAHPRLKILGPLEARLIEADLVLLAGLDEGVWPPQTDTGAFLNRSMRAQLGLMAPERRIGQSAHDFVMALGAERVVLSRAIKRNGAPTIPSRFIARLSALAGDAFDDCRKRGDAMLAIAAALDRPETTIAIERPQPRPPAALRPHRLSVTRVERLRRDPYAIFAEYILKLTPLPPIGAEAGAREIGVAIHEALAAFVARHPRGALPSGARDVLRDLAREKLDGFMADPAFVSFQWPRIEAGLDHAFSFEQERRALDCDIHVETRGEIALALTDGTIFRLTAIADRIEVDREGQAYVFDYKTGAPPSKKQVKAGWSPQLTLEAAMIEAGAFEKIGVRPVSGAAYIDALCVAAASGFYERCRRLRPSGARQGMDARRRRDGMSERPVGALTIRRQQAASDPFTSAWVSAHAGSGKTHVLAQRVLRLLLAGARPSQILCLTYTKAAAANMGSRVFDALARWATLDDAALANEIAQMGATVESRIDLDFARRLFARAVETPGGLKIQTIHAFCEKLLHIFPFEANVPASFRVVDDLERAELMDAARRRALEAATRDNGSLRKALELVARETTAAGFDALCEELLHHRQEIACMREQDDYEARVFAALGLRPEETLARIEAAIIADGEPPSAWPTLAKMLRGGSTNDGKLADSLDSAFVLAPHPDCIESYLAAFFKKDGEPRGLGKTKIITGPLAKCEPQLLVRVEAERDRLVTLIERRKAAAAAERSLALHVLGDAILGEYEHAKRRRGLLDYDDLIEG
ncbi:MAG: Double-strand break repair protein AddB, partial [Methylocystaceae bacterium]